VRKFLTIAIVAAMIASLGAAFAQTSQSHDVEIRIPNVLLIRIVGVVGDREPADNPRVVFDFSADHVAYMAAVEAGEAGPLKPTSVENFGDVIVFSNSETSWSVHLSALPLTFAPHILRGRGAFLDLASIRVRPGQLPDPGVVDRPWRWHLGTTGPIARGRGLEGYRGWRSLGFGGSDYELLVHGDEEPGTYTTIVTYTITQP